jgi:hypothetical protein
VVFYLWVFWSIKREKEKYMIKGVSCLSGNIYSEGTPGGGRKEVSGAGIKT